jgi:ubiquinone/menaquinone biosynthesis C-methylase UbiE
MPRSSKPSTSWQPVSEWYNASVGESGHYYHREIVLPGVLRLLNLSPDSSLLDLACGQGVLSRQLPETVYYQGLDVAKDLIAAAKEHTKSERHHFGVADVTRATLPIQKTDFTHATIILAIQNMRHPEGALQNVAARLRANGRLVIVMNHPCFRIPRQSSWEIDQSKKTQYRRIDRYLSPLEIPITAHPGKRSSAVTMSFHQPLSAYSQMLRQAGFVIEEIAEWSSNKNSEGRAAKMENRARDEFPLFLTFVARKAK